MRLQISKSKNAKSYYVIKTVYNPKTKSNTSKIVEKLGTEVYIKETHNVENADLWAKDYVENLNLLEAQGKIPDVIVKYASQKQISKDKKVSFNCGYLFLQDIYHKLGLHKTCKTITSKYAFDYDLNSVLSRLIYGRIIYPASKLATSKLAKNFIEEPNFDCHQIYRALAVLANESDYIQSELYKNSLKYTKRNTGVIYYDCTNYFFEIEEPDVDGDRQYGKSKENRPNPIIQMGLFMDSDGIPLSFNITPGNTNEQVTLKPLEEKLISDFEMSKFVVCTDAGLASNANRKFNDKLDRAFITTQSIKKLKKHLQEWALSKDGWSLTGSDELFSIENLSEEKDMNKMFYKERWINEDGLSQKMIVTYSLKYALYQKKIRDNQVERAKKAIKNDAKRLKKKNANDFRRFITETATTPAGEMADKKTYSIDNEVATKEAVFDGYYAVCTNLEDDPKEIIKINQKRWEIEECFRIMKSEFEARPVYLQRPDRIKAHFLICFLALTIYRFLEHKLEEKYTCPQIVQTLQDMNMYKISKEGYIPTYTRTALTDALHEKFNFRTDYEIVTEKNMKKILKGTQKG